MLSRWNLYWQVSWAHYTDLFTTHRSVVCGWRTPIRSSFRSLTWTDADKNWEVQLTRKHWSITVSVYAARKTENYSKTCNVIVVYLRSVNGIADWWRTSIWRSDKPVDVVNTEQRRTWLPVVVMARAHHHHQRRHGSSGDESDTITLETILLHASHRIVFSLSALNT